jgi:hypothetical protein
VTNEEISFKRRKERRMVSSSAADEKSLEIPKVKWHCLLATKVGRNWYQSHRQDKMSGQQGSF